MAVKHGSCPPDSPSDGLGSLGVRAALQHTRLSPSRFRILDLGRVPCARPYLAALPKAGAAAEAPMRTRRAATSASPSPPPTPASVVPVDSVFGCPLACWERWRRCTIQCGQRAGCCPNLSCVVGPRTNPHGPCLTGRDGRRRRFISHALGETSEECGCMRRYDRRCRVAGTYACAWRRRCTTCITNAGSPGRHGPGVAGSMRMHTRTATLSLCWSSWLSRDAGANHDVTSRIAGWWQGWVCVPWWAIQLAATSRARTSAMPTS